jgi:hypothetical protein
MDLGQKDPAIDPQARKETEAELAAIRATLKSWTVSNSLHVLLSGFGPFNALSFALTAG